jgi:hypothetical protein
MHYGLMEVYSMIHFVATSIDNGQRIYFKNISSKNNKQIDPQLIAKAEL